MADHDDTPNPGVAPDDEAQRRFEFGFLHGKWMDEEGPDGRKRRVYRYLTRGVRGNGSGMMSESAYAEFGEREAQQERDRIAAGRVTPWKRPR